MSFITKINVDDRIKNSTNTFKNYFSQSNAPYSSTVMTFNEESSSPTKSANERKRIREELAKKYSKEIKNGKMYNYLFKYPVYYYNQGDFNQDVCKTPVDGMSHTIAKSGCGITCMAMLVSTFLQRNVEPTEIGETAFKTGSFKGDGFGTNVSKIPDTLAEYGLKAKGVSGDYNGQKLVKEALKSNNALVIVNVGPGNFTAGGHYMLLTDINSYNEVFVLDPNSNPEKYPERGNTNRYYDFDYICSQLQSNDTPFIIVTE